MFIIAGLGNPTNKYKNTRHNAGFDAIDFLSEYYNIKIDKSAFNGSFGDGYINGEKLILLKPETYMNNSGECIGKIVRYYNLNPKQDLCIISDDVTLSSGRIRVRDKGRHGGHNGLKSIINHLGTDEFIRVRMGVGIFNQSEIDDLSSFVLSKMPKDERTHFDELLNKLPDLITLLVNQDIQGAMNKFNGLIM